VSVPNQRAVMTAVNPGFGKGVRQRPAGRKSPVGSMGKVPVIGLRDEVPQRSANYTTVMYSERKRINILSTQHYRR